MVGAMRIAATAALDILPALCGVHKFDGLDIESCGGGQVLAHIINEDCLVSLQLMLRQQVLIYLAVRFDLLYSTGDDSSVK